MKVLAEPNWFVIVGLAYTFYGLCQLAGAATVSSAAASPATNAAEQAAKRSIFAAFSMVLLGIGFANLLIAQFASLPFGGMAVLLMLGLAMLGLFFALVGDLWAERVAAPSCIGSSAFLARPSGAVMQAIDPKRRVDFVHAAQ